LLFKKNKQFHFLVRIAVAGKKGANPTRNAPDRFDFSPTTTSSRRTAHLPPTRCLTTMTSTSPMAIRPRSRYVHNNPVSIEKQIILAFASICSLEWLSRQAPAKKVHAHASGSSIAMS
jgi:hypothetical protein